MLLNSCIVATDFNERATNISLLPPLRTYLKPLTFVVSLILSKKLMFL